ncbi:SRPBCC family protein [Microbacterium koreense]|uniref:SRPBCC family protein n=1 Tax=Microbacterium koreense TaxID=323761 RepID=A0ABW2ZNM4_9MICO
MRSHHVSRVVSAEPEVVYDFASNVDNLSQWAAGLSRSDVIRDGDVLIVESPMGQVRVRFVDRNSFGILDHDVTLPSGTVVTNPVRVLAHPDGAEIVFTIRQLDLDDDEFARDIATVAADLDRLAAIVERRRPGSAPG